jgi:hypothetical protein
MEQTLGKSMFALSALYAVPRCFCLHTRDKFSYDTAVTIVEADRSSQSGISNYQSPLGYVERIHFSGKRNCFSNSIGEQR